MAIGNWIDYRRIDRVRFDLTAMDHEEFVFPFLWIHEFGKKLWGSSYIRAKKMLVAFHEQKRILQFNNQNLHNSNIEHIIDLTYT